MGSVIVPHIQGDGNCAQAATAEEDARRLDGVQANSVSFLAQRALSGYRGRFREFCGDLFAIKLTTQQLDGARALEDHRQVLIQGGNGVGKNTLTALWRVLTKSTPHTGPVHEQTVARGRIKALREEWPQRQDRELIHH